MITTDQLKIFGAHTVAEWRFKNFSTVSDVLADAGGSYGTPTAKRSGTCKRSVHFHRLLFPPFTHLEWGRWKTSYFTLWEATPQKSHCSSKIPFVVSAGANPSSHQTYWYPPWSKKIKLYFCKKDRTQNHFIVQFNDAQLRQHGSASGHLAAAIFRRPWPRVRKGHMRFVFLICAYPIQRFRLQSGIRSIPPTFCGK